MGNDRLIASCVRNGQFELAEYYMQRGANPNLKGREGQQPLHMAVAMRDAAMVRSLLENGVDPNKHFVRPASKAFLELTKKESMRWFLKNERRVTPLMMSANNGDLPIIASLMDYGAKKFVYTGRHRLYPLNFAGVDVQRLIRIRSSNNQQMIIGKDNPLGR